MAGAWSGMPQELPGEAHQPQLLALWHSNNHSQIIIGNIQDNLVLGNYQAPASIAMWTESSIDLT